jgi:hypothetical protein
LLPKIVDSREHPATTVDPFNARPCRCDTVIVHITDGETMGDDIAECPRCGWKMTLRELYKDVVPPDLTR